jgi:hypothetical protein
MDADLVRFTGSLCASRTFGELERVFATGFPKALDAPMYGFDLVQPRRWVRVNVSDAFVAAYEREADPVRTQALATRHAVYNRALMSATEWERTAVYRNAYGCTASTT